MGDRNIELLKVKDKYYDKDMCKWVKNFIIKLDSDVNEYYIRLTSLDNKVWYLDKGTDIGFADQSLKMKLYNDCHAALEVDDMAKIDSIFKILDRQNKIRNNINHFIPQLLAMTEDKAKS